MGAEVLSEGALADLKEMCGELEQRVKRDYKLECKSVYDWIQTGQHE